MQIFSYFPLRPIRGLSLQERVQQKYAPRLIEGVAYPKTTKKSFKYTMAKLQQRDILQLKGSCIVMLNSTCTSRNNGDISGSITRNWTEQALECYKLNGDCKRCSIAEGHYSFECQMPKVVDILLAVNGEPVIKR